MKKLIFLFISINLLITYTYSQSTYFCGTDMLDITSFTNETFGAEGQNRTLESFQDDTPIVLKVHFWDINQDDGSNPHPITLERALEAVAELNKNYNAFNIYFKFDAINPINSTLFYDFEFNNNEQAIFVDFLRDHNYFTQGAINIYSVNYIDNSLAFASADGTYGDFTYIVSRHEAIAPVNIFEYDFVLTHEVAHNFNIMHVFFCGMIGDYNCENVIREPNHPDYNADTAGDFIIDTNATPKNMLYDPNDCTYIPNGETDPTGLPYNYNGLEPEVTNFMSYSLGCNNEFSAGQVAHMRWYIQLIDELPDIDAFEIQPVSILFEPFEGKYRYCDDNYAVHNPRFQPGFNYQFIECRELVYGTLDCPSEYGNYPFIYGEDVYGFDTTVSYSSSYRFPIIHPNHTAIRIFQLSGAQLVEQPEKCYDSWKKSLSGSLIRFTDGVINTNYTIEYLDSIQSNNPTLIQDLNNGLYNIQKNYNDGNSNQQTILKTNN